jgi:hypothetical protein
LKLAKMKCKKRRLQQRFLRLCLILALPLWAAHAVALTNDRGEARLTLGRAKISVAYGRPKLNGRNPLSLIGPGEIWQAGAGSPTTFSSTADLDFDGVRVPKGKHFLLVRYVANDLWSIIFSSRPAQDYEPSVKLAEVPALLQTSHHLVDELTMRLERHGGSGALRIEWGQLSLVGTFRVAN